jgi:epoxyqueuosine reductase
MTPAERSRWICEQACALGFELCGVVSVAPASTTDSPARAVPEELARLPEWLARGYAGEMNYLSDPRRADPSLILGGVRSLIVVALNYNTDYPYSTDVPPGTTSAGATSAGSNNDSPSGWISRYAWGDDYHEILSQKLTALVAAMRAQFGGPFDERFYVDTGPVIERIAAKYAGLGWLAKNTCLINEQLGSWLFLGVIVTTLELAPSLPPDEPPAPDLCGNCRLCLDACPTQAFPEPYVLDARRCISYLTIELRGSIPEELRANLGRAAIGCDICQDVCPWNRKAPTTRLAEFLPRKIDARENWREQTKNSGYSLFSPNLEWLASLTQEDFSRIFRGSAVKRAKWRGLVRNACVALGNSHVARESEAYQRISLLLSRLVDSEDALIAEHARWALAQLALNEPLVGFSG